MRIIGDNPQNLVKPMRAAMMSRTFKEADIACFAGTLQKQGAVYEGQIARFEHEENAEISFGHVRERYTNKSAGVSIMYSRKSSGQRAVMMTRQPPQMLAGRMGLGRLKSKYLDVTVLVLYFPPRQTAPDKQEEYHRTVQGMVGSSRTAAASATKVDNTCDTHRPEWL
eukprot:TRINITY_DN110717_c0_g1_i1.p1 TRINITY_DN110717_c0_g1~~TRINITY_DN110717_c0_g1_i1.p1  ORF type:complete len:168 (-),score=27.28 TRINITY_DN110717_c0_g1_i1:234-737(-)